MKRLIALVLIAALLLSAVPVFGYAAEKTTPDDVFAAIDSAIETAQKQRGTLTDVRKTQLAKTAVEQLGIKTEAHGNCCFIYTVDGEPCIFNCRMYNIFSEMKPVEGYVDDGQVVTVDYSKRSSGPDSKDVYLIEPFYGTDRSFTKQYQNEASSIAAATGGKYTLYKTSAATVDAVADSLEAGGVVFFDSHGDTDYYEYPDRGDYVSEANTSYLLLATGTGLTSADKSKATGEFSTYNHAYGSSGYYYVDGTAITNHMEKDAPNSLVWMAICLGMATDGLEKPLREHGVGVVYGYSQSVTFDGDYDYEETFWTNMKKGTDVKTAIAAMKSKHGNWDPGMGCSSISSARREYAAFPIVVSDLDVYPGHGNVDDYQTVNSDWELFGKNVHYTVNAVSANPAYGTVSLDGQTVTADPKEGYAVSTCTVEPADACKVTQNGNAFILSELNADCTVTVSFVPRTAAEVRFSVPEGVSCESLSAYVGDTVKLPAPTGAPTANRYNYTFLGWTAEPVNETEAAPSYLPAGSELTLTGDQTFYALYSYSLSEEGTGSSFRALTEEQPDYSGDYVLGYLGEVFLDASGENLNSAIGGKNAAISAQTAGVSCVEDTLYGVPESLIYELTLCDAKNNLYTVRMKGSQNYLTHTLLPNALTTTTKPEQTGAQWKIVKEDGILRLKNESTGRTLQYNITSALFRCYANGTYEPVTLYSGGKTKTMYTTNLLAACPHDWGITTTLALPTCTENGARQLTCVLCGENKIESIAALGHDIVDDDPVAPTCTESGLTAGEHCTRCDYLIAQESIPALGHDYVDGICSRCGETEPGIDPPEPDDPCDGYIDIDRSAWYHTYADFVIEKDLMGSTTPDALTFEPATACTRSMIVTILYSLAGKPEVTYEERFPDVPDGQWFTAPVIWAYQNGVVSGYDNGNFGTNDKITREQMAVILKAYAERIIGADTSASADLSAYPDSAKVTWSKAAVSWAVAEGLISGKAVGGETLLDPQGNASRAEVAVILTKFLSK